MEYRTLSSWLYDLPIQISYALTAADIRCHFKNGSVCAFSLSRRRRRSRRLSLRLSLPLAFHRLLSLNVHLPTSQNLFALESVYMASRLWLGGRRHGRSQNVQMLWPRALGTAGCISNQFSLHVLWRITKKKLNLGWYARTDKDDTLKSFFFSSTREISKYKRMKKEKTKTK